jgi:hypothetical protein
MLEDALTTGTPLCRLTPCGGYTVKGLATSAPSTPPLFLSREEIRKENGGAVFEKGKT